MSVWGNDKIQERVFQFHAKTVNDVKFENKVHFMSFDLLLSASLLYIEMGHRARIFISEEHSLPLWKCPATGYLSSSLVTERRCFPNLAKVCHFLQWNHVSYPRYTVKWCLISMYNRKSVVLLLYWGNL